MTLTEVLEEPGRPQSSASHPQLTFRSKEQVIGGFEGPEQDEFDKVLASLIKRLAALFKRLTGADQADDRC